MNDLGVVVQNQLVIVFFHKFCNAFDASDIFGSDRRLEEFNNSIKDKVIVAF